MKSKESKFVKSAKAALFLIFVGSIVGIIAPAVDFYIEFQVNLSSTQRKILATYATKDYVVEAVEVERKSRIASGSRRGTVMYNDRNELLSIGLINMSNLTHLSATLKIPLNAKYANYLMTKLEDSNAIKLPPLK